MSMYENRSINKASGNEIIESKYIIMFNPRNRRRIIFFIKYRNQRATKLSENKESWAKYKYVILAERNSINRNIDRRS